MPIRELDALYSDSILINHSFVQDARYSELTCTRCGGLYSEMRAIYFQCDPNRTLEQARELFESVCAGPGSADWSEDRGLTELRRIAEL